MKEDQRAEESLKSDQVRSESAYSFVCLFIYSSGRGNYFPSAPLQRSNKWFPLCLSSPLPARLSPNLQPKQLTDFARVGNYGSRATAFHLFISGNDAECLGCRRLSGRKLPTDLTFTRAPRFGLWQSVSFPLPMCVCVCV